MKPAPIAFFAYNRLQHTRRAIEALARNELAIDSPLYLFSDGPRSAADVDTVDSVRSYLRSVGGFRSVKIVARPGNFGLAGSIISGVTEICRQHERVIVLEDDLVTSPFFLRYMNGALDLYANTTEVISIHGYVYPVPESMPETFFIRGADCWGWATWQRGWAEFETNGATLLCELEKRGLASEFDFGGSYFSSVLRDQIAGRNDSWAIRWCASAFLRERLTLYPGRSLVANTGHDGSGIHCPQTAEHDVELTERPIQLERLPISENEEARAAFGRYFRNQTRSVPNRTYAKVVNALVSNLRRLSRKF